MTHGRRAIASILLLGMLPLALLFASTSLAAEGSYEPNDSPLSAAGPLLSGQSYTAALEIPGDRDFFFFYVTSAPSAQVILRVTNLSGGTSMSDIDATVLDASSTPVAGLAYIRKGEERPAAVTLAPQKYFVEIAPNEGYGDTYSLTLEGSEGAIGPYARIAGRCAAATDAVSAAEVGLRRARAKLQRATSRLRRSLYGTRDTRTAAQSLHKKARKRAKVRQRALRAARTKQTPWCFIGA